MRNLSNKIRKIILVGTILGTATSSVASELALVAVPAPAIVTSAAPVAPAAPVADLTQLPAASTIMLTPIANITTKTLKIGDHVDLVTAAETKLGDAIVIPAGAKAQATVVSTAKRGAFGRGGRFEIQFESLTLADGRTVQLTGTHYEQGAKGDTQNGSNLAATGAALLGGFGGIGALAGLLGRAAISGSSAVIKTGAQLKAFTAKPFDFAANSGAPAIAEVSKGPAAISLEPVVAASATK
jgi:hypothetical protein